MRIGGREIGGGAPVYIIAEIGVNHDGSVARALELADAAAEAGADAVKLQYFEADCLMSRAAKLAAYQRAAGEGDPLAMLRRLEMGLEDMARVVRHAHERGLQAIVSVFSVEHVGAVAELGWDAFKTASPDIVHRPLLESLARVGPALIVSTGASTLEEVERAAGWLSGARDRLGLLQCVSCYPAPEAALGGIGAIASATGLPCGYSDHTDAIETGARAVECGAVVLEKHFTYDTSAAGPDHAASLDVEGMGAYVRLARSACGGAAAGGRAGKWVLECEREVRGVSRQSIVLRRGVEAGQVIGAADVAYKRPGGGIEPWAVDGVIGRAAARAIEADIPLVWDDLCDG